MRGRVFEIREFTLHDGPGIRTTVFFKGCPLRCAWCHNPEGQSFEVETLYRRDGTTVTCGDDWTAPDLARELLVNADIFHSSGGGVTLSGGEPLAQSAFLDELIPLLRAASPRFGLAIETSGYAAPTDYRRIVSQMDFVYQDVKLPDAASFRQWCGGDLSVVLENLAWLKTSGVPFVVRVPCIPRVNDMPSVRAAIEDLVGTSPTLQRIEYLPYNPAAGAKYPMLHRTYPLASC